MVTRGKLESPLEKEESHKSLLQDMKVHAFFSLFQYSLGLCFIDVCDFLSVSFNGAINC